METTAHFDGISAEIARHLRVAAREIVVAVAWFTDRTLFDLLCQQAGRGVRVRIAVLDDQINTGPGRLHFQRLQEIGGEVYLIPGGERDAIMHHKFCVIDAGTLIVGSYNWTNRAQVNDENIVVIVGAEQLANDYRKAFEALLAKHRLGTPYFDATQIRQRLDVLRTLIRLEDWEAAEFQQERIRPASASMELQVLLDAISRRDSHAALAWLDNFLARATAVTRATDHDLVYLKLELRALEIQLTALSDEQAELERQIREFSVRASHAYGDLMTRYLRLRAQKLRRDAAEEAEQAETDYRDYRDAEEATRNEPEPTQLPPDTMRELKTLYRQASQKCHPDKVSEADREHARVLFVQLQAAYQQNDLAGVRAIHAAVREGSLFVERSTLLTEREALGRAILNLRRQVHQLAATVRQLRDSETYKIIKELSDWNDYFSAKRDTIEQAIAEMEDELIGELSCHDGF